jgi:hypothetical protein
MSSLLVPTSFKPPASKQQIKSRNDNFAEEEKKNFYSAETKI